MVFPFTQNICVTTRTNQVGGDRKIFNNPPVCTCPSLGLFTGSSPSFGLIPGMKGSWNETSSQTPPSKKEVVCTILVLWIPGYTVFLAFRLGWLISDIQAIAIVHTRQ